MTMGRKSAELEQTVPRTNKVICRYTLSVRPFRVFAQDKGPRLSIAGNRPSFGESRDRFEALRIDLGQPFIDRAYHVRFGCRRRTGRIKALRHASVAPPELLYRGRLRFGEVGIRFGTPQLRTGPQKAERGRTECDPIEITNYSCGERHFLAVEMP